MTLTIERAHAPTEAVAALVAELDAALAQHYAAEQRHGLALAAIFQPHIHFFVASRDGALLGCGGVALFAAFAEVKRMFVRASARGQGVGLALLARLERTAAEAGKGWLRLETGTQQFAAMRLYERAGFRRCAAFGDYAAMPPAQVAESVFMEKRL